MNRHIATVALVVDDYDHVRDWFSSKLGFETLEDTVIGPGKRWLRMRPVGGGVAILLAKAAGAEQESRIGNQTGGRVFLFLEVDDFQAEHAVMRDRGVNFLEAPRHEPYGWVAVFEDVLGNRWDLLGRA